MEVPCVPLLNMNDAFRTEGYQIEEYLLSKELNESLATSNFPDRRARFTPERNSALKQKEIPLKMCGNIDPDVYNIRHLHTQPTVVMALSEALFAFILLLSHTNGLLRLPLVKYEPDPPTNFDYDDILSIMRVEPGDKKSFLSNIRPYFKAYSRIHCDRLFQEFYVVKIQVGDDGEEFSVELDTETSFLVLASTNCSNCETSVQGLDMTSSGSIVDTFEDSCIFTMVYATPIDNVQTLQERLSNACEQIRQQPVRKKLTSVHVSKQFTFLPLPALPYVSRAMTHFELNIQYMLIEALLQRWNINDVIAEILNTVMPSDCSALRFGIRSNYQRFMLLEEQDNDLSWHKSDGVLGMNFGVNTWEYVISSGGYPMVPIKYSYEPKPLIQSLTGGQMVLGGSDPSLRNGSLAYANVIPDQFSWRVPLQGFRMDNYNVGHCEVSLCAAIVDPATSFIWIPDTQILYVVLHLHTQVPTIRRQNFMQSNRTGTMFFVKEEDIPKLKPIQFVLAGRNFTLEPSDYVLSHLNIRDETVLSVTECPMLCAASS
ncbi:hypothetical protein ANN_04930 [Periplaneta americana]|uniref:Peptidase A1 domain-containing protein n=1 Tax=Periplaneta americana TaxID=6978 RepID=A0ABQ8T9N7_PERAM|nr:hypothetical protein ANN_04930 [Periplaneta americana]